MCVSVWECWKLLCRIGQQGFSQRASTVGWCGVAVCSPALVGHFVEWLVGSFGWVDAGYAVRFINTHRFD